MLGVGIKFLKDATEKEWRDATCYRQAEDGPKTTGKKVYKCVYTVTTSLTGATTYNMDGKANRDRCTEFSTSCGQDPGGCRADCYVVYEDDEPQSVSIVSQTESTVAAIVLIVFGCVTGLALLVSCGLFLRLMCVGQD
eukprot:CAMPEP_0172671400 /NCGR_PEP_ID=MMETSP1074-20121228/10894_1 /TAXON_ID=2916 /ORGANISM="Ceratium fusus, Strain PA161109" /LENGTH=137 /DNA_ID=CAMNT_0013488439 /DNA_START=200 /DNA_END=613 /DNA_ORIENTATION=+